MEERVRQILQKDMSDQPPQDGMQPAQYNWEEFTHEQDVSKKLIHSYSQQKRQALIDGKCDELFEQVKDPDTHWNKLDGSFSSLLWCQWWRTINSLLQQKIVSETCALLSRLPSVATKLPDKFSTLPLEYFLGPEKSWATLKVVAFLPTNVVRFILIRVACANGVDKWVEMFAQDILIRVGELIETTVKKSKLSETEIERGHWVIVRAYLWKFWQACRIFYAADRIRYACQNVGSYDSNDAYEWFHNFKVSEGLSLRGLTENSSILQKSTNTCSWTLQLLCSHSHGLGQDFGLLHERHRAVLGETQSRCSADGKTSCSGRRPQDCLRYRGLKLQDQSMHDSTCIFGNPKEPKLTWDSDSYKSVVGARAVSVFENEQRDGKLRYCQASEKTMAISHVWSHGQGGRPHHGINRCLHKRYVQLAEKLDCDSYWIDTMCIPAEHILRREAITHINEVFYRSCAVIICDQDLMSIDVSSLSTEVYESIFCATLLSDWNTRAWTILEGLKGRRNTYILCKDNCILGFSEVIRNLCEGGNMSILAFAHQIVHILPWDCHGWRGQLIPGKSRLDIEVVGSWLSHRPASRKGDDIVIWSLLLSQNSVPVLDAEEFWRKQQWVHTGFLLSSAERLKKRGLTWAPRSPYVIPFSSKLRRRTIYQRPRSSLGTALATIDERGITGEWYMVTFGSEVAPLGKRLWPNGSKRTATELELAKVLARYVRLGRIGALLHPISRHEYGAKTAVPSGKFLIPVLPSVPGEGNNGTLLAVCDCVMKSFRYDTALGIENCWSWRWEWRGVHEWPRDVPLPDLRRDRFVWIG